MQSLMNGEVGERQCRVGGFVDRGRGGNERGGCERGVMLDYLRGKCGRFQRDLLVGKE